MIKKGKHKERKYISIRYSIEQSLKNQCCLSENRLNIDSLISSRRPDPELTRKMNSTSYKFCHSDGLLNENKRKDIKYLDLTKELQMLWNLMMMMIPVVVSVLRKVLNLFRRKTAGTGNQTINSNHPDYRSVKIG